MKDEEKAKGPHGAPKDEPWPSSEQPADPPGQPAGGGDPDEHGPGDGEDDGGTTQGPRKPAPIQPESPKPGK